MASQNLYNFGKLFNNSNFSSKFTYNNIKNNGVFRFLYVGKIDDLTIKQFNQPRCGVKDILPGDQPSRNSRKKRFAIKGLKWHYRVSEIFNSNKMHSQP